jgi:hypothetical protein
VSPTGYEEYMGADRDLMLSGCLHIASVLGDLMDHVTLVGGLVPSLLAQREPSPHVAAVEPHPGSKDIDLGLELALFDADRYAGIVDRLRDAGFAPDTNPSGNETHQRWRCHGSAASTVLVDFLIDRTKPEDEPGSVKHIDTGFGATVTPGLELVTRDRWVCPLEGGNLDGSLLRRDLWVCGAASFVILKARAIRGRRKAKDAYDLTYVLRTCASVPALAAAIRRLCSHPAAEEALRWLAEDFETLDHAGPADVARFSNGTRDDDLQADVCGLVQELLRLLSAR